jgi:hypothetical protein
MASSPTAAGAGTTTAAHSLSLYVHFTVVQLQTSNQKRNLPTAVWWLDGSTAAGGAAQAQKIAAGLAMPVLLQVQGVSGPAGDASSVSAAAAAAGQVDSSAPSGTTDIQHSVVLLF